MAKASINFQAATDHSNDHNDRKSKVSYLIIHDNKVNLYRNFSDEKKDLEKAELIYKEKVKQKMQKSAKDNFVQEAILNLEEYHTIDHVEDVFKKLQDKYGGFNLFNIAIHKDEGVFIDSIHDISTLTYDSISQRWLNDLEEDLTSEVISVSPNRDIFYNENDKNWYAEKAFINQIDTDKLQKHMNYHAHVTFTKFDFNNGKNIRLQKKDMQDIQTLVAEELGMKRGEKGSNRKRLNHWQLKKQNDLLNAQKIEQKEINTNLLATQKNLKEEIKKQREKLQEAKAQRADYAELEELNRNLKQQIKNKDLTIEDLEKRFKKLEEDKTLILGRERKKESETSETILKSDKTAYEETIQHLKQKNSDFISKYNKDMKVQENFIKKELDLEDDNPTLKEKGVFHALRETVKGFKETIKNYKDKIHDLLFENKTLKEENTELKKENQELRNQGIEEISTSSDEITPIPNISENLNEMEDKNRRR